MADVLSYVNVAGALTRRGTYVPPDPPEIIVEDFEDLAVAASLGTTPAGRDAFRNAVHDPTYGYIQEQHALMAVEDLGGVHDKSIKVTFPDTYLSSAPNNGIGYTPKLPRTVEAVTVSQLVRFRSGFVSGKGGKFGVGVGWSNRHRQPASGGSDTQPHAGTFRWMWRDDFRLSPYLYDANGVNGVGLTTSPASVTTPSDFGWHLYEFDLVLNTALVDSGPLAVAPAVYTPPTVVEGVDYQADGVLRCRVDGLTIYEATNRVLRKYSDTLLTHLTWSWFRGGSDTTWNVAGGPFAMDIAEYEVTEL